jgi:hypothetical protein
MKALFKHGLVVVGIGLSLGAGLQSGAGAAQQPPPRPWTGGFTEPTPIDFNDHEGYVPLFDGVSLKGSGLFGIEIEATTRVSVRNIWAKKLG